MAKTHGRSTSRRIMVVGGPTGHFGVNAAHPGSQLGPRIVTGDMPNALPNPNGTFATRSNIDGRWHLAKGVKIGKTPEAIAKAEKAKAERRAAAKEKRELTKAQQSRAGKALSKDKAIIMTKSARGGEGAYLHKTPDGQYAVSKTGNTLKQSEVKTFSSAGAAVKYAKEQGYKSFSAKRGTGANAARVAKVDSFGKVKYDRAPKAASKMQRSSMTDLNRKRGKGKK